MPTTAPLSPDRIDRCYQHARAELLAERNGQGHWSGQLSTSALSTATALMALEMIDRDRPHSEPLATPERLRELIDDGLRWLANHQNDDGGWGDTVKSISNISTTMLVHAVFHAAARDDDRFQPTVAAAKACIDRVGGVDAVIARYGKDKTFSIPILTHCALAGLVDWNDIQPLPFELACIPHRFYKTVRLPVVSYALPALIAIGQVRHHHGRPKNPIARLIRSMAAAPSLKKLDSIQPANGGFLEATPLTSFVTMSLAGMGLSDHPVARRGLMFILNSVLPDGSWPIDTNLATWVTTLAINALGDDLPKASQGPLREWLLGQQYREVHPFTNAAPGGWAWTDLPGGVPDADDTPGAVLAILKLGPASNDEDDVCRYRDSLAAAVAWLLDLQNADGGWPTFCRGWGALPFDRSAPDLTAHALRALSAWRNAREYSASYESLLKRTSRAVRRGFQYLDVSQRDDGSWLPLWFGNQHAPDDINPTYGTSRVLAAYRDLDAMDKPAARAGIDWLIGAQNDDGGWGGVRGTDSSVEETSVAIDVLLAARPEQPATQKGLVWLLDRVDDGRWDESTPIGFYFAKLWYFERLYPKVFAVSALRRATQRSAASRAHDSRQRRREFEQQTVAD